MGKQADYFADRLREKGHLVFALDSMHEEALAEDAERAATSPSSLRQAARAELMTAIVRKFAQGGNLFTRPDVCQILSLICDDFGIDRQAQGISGFSVGDRVHPKRGGVIETVAEVRVLPRILEKEPIVWQFRATNSTNWRKCSDYRFA